MMCSEAKIEDDLSGSRVDVQTLGRHRSKVFDSTGDGKTNVLRRGCTCVMVDRRVDSNRGDVWIVLGSPCCQFGEQLQCSGCRNRQLTLTSQNRQWIGIEGASRLIDFYFAP